MGSLDPDAIDGQPDLDQEELQAEALPDAGQQRFRYRISYTKDGPLRYTSQLDLARIWERVLRRAGLPLIYSQGFNPRPKIQLAVGLPLGYASRCELVDIWLQRELTDLPSVITALNVASPEGLVTGAIQTVDVHAPALQSVVWSASYWVTLRDSIDPETLSQRVGDLLAQQELWHERRDKRVNLRPLIDRLQVALEPEVGLEMVLAASPVRGTARPDEILHALGLDASSAFVTRTALAFEPGSPAESGSTSAL